MCTCSNSCSSSCSLPITIPVGPQGETGSAGPTGAAGADGAAYVPAVLVNEYMENIETKNIGDNPNAANYDFPSVGYAGLSYTNNTGATLILEVHANWQCGQLVAGTPADVDAGLIKTVSAVDSVEWETPLQTTVVYTIRENGSNSIVGIGTAETVKTTAGNHDLYLSEQGAIVEQVGHMFKKLTLLDGESISLKFKTKNVGTDSVITKAQLYVKQLLN